MTTEFLVPDASCGHCKETIEGALSRLDGVTQAELDLESKKLCVEHDDALSSEALAAVITQAGYNPERAA